MLDSQKNKKSAQIRGQSEAVQFNNIEKRLPGRIHCFHILPGYCSIDRAGILPQLILNQTSGSPLLPLTTRLDFSTAITTQHQAPNEKKITNRIFLGSYKV